MAISQRGKKRVIKKAVPVTPNLYFGFASQNLSGIAGLPTSAINALGQVDLSTATKPIAFGCNAPKAARFTYRLPITSPQSSVSTFGDGLNNTVRAENEGWRLSKPIKLARLGGQGRLRGVAVLLSIGIYVVRPVNVADVTPENASRFGWITDPKATIQSKLITSCPSLRAATVSKKVDGKTLSFPCKSTKIATLEAEGWRLTSPEFVSRNNISLPE